MKHQLPISPEDRKVLARVRKTYGTTAQLLVAIEELDELSKVCCKFPRYENQETAREKLHDKAVDEVSDFIVVLDHIFDIFDLDWKEVVNHIPTKVERVTRWLSKSNSMEQTTIDRDLHPVRSGCSGCAFQELQGTAGRCKTCKDQSGFKPKLPCHTCKNYGKYTNLAPGGKCFICVEQNGSMFEPIKENREDEAI